MGPANALRGPYESFIFVYVLREKKRKRMDLRVVVANKLQVYLLFYRPSRTDPLLNRVVAFFDGPFSHVEMAFPDRYGDEPWERTVWGASIYQGETVFLKQKTYKREGYVSIAIEVTPAQLVRIRRFCQSHAERQTPFHLWAMYAAYLPVQLVETEGTFCSKFVTHALQAASIGAVEDANAALMTPSRLYHRLKSQAILQVVPSRMLAMRQQLLVPPAAAPPCPPARVEPKVFSPPPWLVLRTQHDDAAGGRRDKPNGASPPPLFVLG